ncbi:MAG: SdpI family protein [Chitinophagales bacterium]
MDKFIKRIIWLIILVPAVYLAFAWNSLPQKIAMHFDIRGNADGYGSKSGLLLVIVLLSVLNAGIYLLLTNIYRIDPKKYAAENKGRLHRIAFAVSVFMAAVLCLVIYSSVHGNMKFSTRLIFAGVGLLFSFIGNYMHNIKPNYFAGIRLPWTLENEENWKQTHLLAGKVWFAGGLLIAIVCLLSPLVISIVLFFTITFSMIMIPCVFSYRLYKKQKTINTTGQS